MTANVVHHRCLNRIPLTYVVSVGTACTLLPFSSIIHHISIIHPLLIHIYPFLITQLIHPYLLGPPFSCISAFMLKLLCALCAHTRTALPLNFSYTGATFKLTLVYSFLILFIRVTPHIHLSVCNSLLSFYAFVAQHSDLYKTTVVRDFALKPTVGCMLFLLPTSHPYCHHTG